MQIKVKNVYEQIIRYNIYPNHPNPMHIPVPSSVITYHQVS